MIIALKNCENQIKNLQKFGFFNLKKANQTYHCQNFKKLAINQHKIKGIKVKSMHHVVKKIIIFLIN